MFFFLQVRGHQDLSELYLLMVSVRWTFELTVVLSELFSQALFHFESFLRWCDSEGLKSTAGPGSIFLMDHDLCGKCLFLDVSQPSGSLLGRIGQVY